MGEIAEMMLDGTLCEGCGEWLGNEGEPAGYAIRCEACSLDDADDPLPPPKQRRGIAKTRRRS